MAVVARGPGVGRRVESRHLLPVFLCERQGMGTSIRRTLTVVRPVIVHLRVCKLSRMISPAKGEKSLDMLHSTTGRGIKQDSVT